MDRIRVMVVDDHAIARVGLVSLLETEEGIEVVGQCEDGEAALADALDAGASGALMKNTGISDLIDAIRAVADGRRAVAPEIEQMITECPPVPELTRRQMEILHSVTRGLTNRDIACQLGITVDCVKDHINAILVKIGAANRAEAVAISLRKHLLKI